MKNNRPQHPEQLLHLFRHVLGQPPQPRRDGYGGFYLQQDVGVQGLQPVRFLAPDKLVHALPLHVLQQGESLRLLLRLLSLHLLHIQDLDIHCDDKQTDSKIMGTLKRSLSWRRLMPSSR
jgi:hypothetical protein